MNYTSCKCFLWGIILLVFLGLNCNGAIAETCSWSGVWQTNKGLLELTQNGQNIYGKYDKDKGSIRGVINGIMLDANYTYGTVPNLSSGTAKFTITNHCNSINGVWKTNNQSNWEVERWMGNRVVLDQVHKTVQKITSTGNHYADKIPSCNWTGYYKTTKGNVKLTQKGYRVVGLFDNDRCGLKCYIEGQAIEGEWACGKQKGRVRFIMNPLCDGFKGQEFTSGNQINEWNGTRSDYVNVNKIDGRIGNGTLIADQYKVCKWDGYWKTEIGTFLATQEGYKVTAQFKDNSRRTIIAYSQHGSGLEGDITDYHTGKKLEHIRIHMNPDCQSFDGNRNISTLQNPPAFHGTRINTIGSNDVIKKVPDTSTSLPTKNSCNWTGKWITNPTGEINITQNGNHFTGSYLLDNGKIEGKVVDNTLVGTWSDGPTYKAPYDAGQIIYRMSSDCQSFTVDFRGGYDDMNLPWTKSAWSAKRASH